MRSSRDKSEISRYVADVLREYSIDLDSTKAKRRLNAKIQTLNRQIKYSNEQAARRLLAQIKILKSSKGLFK